MPRQCKIYAIIDDLFNWHLNHILIFFSVQSSSEKAAKDLFQMYEAVKDEDNSKQAK